MTYTKTNTACGEMTRSAFGPAGPGGHPEATDSCDSFDDLLAGSSFNTPGPGAPERAHALLDQMWQQSSLQDPAPEGDVDDVLVHIVDLAARGPLPSQVERDRAFDANFYKDSYTEYLDRYDDVTREARFFVMPFGTKGGSLPRPTWIYPLTRDHCVIDRAGAEVISLRHLSAVASQEVVSFVEYGDPRSAQAVVADLIEANVFATVRPEVARALVALIFDNRALSQPILTACEQAITASGLFDDLELSQFTEKKGGDAYDQFENHIAIPLPAKATTSAPRGPTHAALERRPVWRLALFPDHRIVPPPPTHRGPDQLPVAAALPGRRQQDAAGRRGYENVLWRLASGQLNYQIASQNHRERDRAPGWFTPLWSFFIHLLAVIRSWRPSTPSWKPLDAKVFDSARAWTTAGALLIAAIPAVLAAALALMLASER